MDKERGTPTTTTGDDDGQQQQQQEQQESQQDDGTDNNGGNENTSTGAAPTTTIATEAQPDTNTRPTFYYHIQPPFTMKEIACLKKLLPSKLVTENSNDGNNEGGDKKDASIYHDIAKKVHREEMDRKNRRKSYDDDEITAFVTRIKSEKGRSAKAIELYHRYHLQQQAQYKFTKQQSMLILHHVSSSLQSISTSNKTNGR